MAALTAAQITHIRRMSGDYCPDEEDCSDYKYEVSDEYMQYLYDTFGSAEPLCMSSDPLGSTIVWVLRARVRRAAMLFDENDEGGARNVSQKYSHLRRELESAEEECGFDGMAILGTLDLGIDGDVGVNGLSTFGYPYSWWGLLS